MLLCKGNNCIPLRVVHYRHTVRILLGGCLAEQGIRLHFICSSYAVHFHIGVVAAGQVAVRHYSTKGKAVLCCHILQILVFQWRLLETALRKIVKSEVPYCKIMNSLYRMPQEIFSVRQTICLFRKAVCRCPGTAVSRGILRSAYVVEIVNLVFLRIIFQKLCNL